MRKHVVVLAPVGNTLIPCSLSHMTHIWTMHTVFITMIVSVVCFVFAWSNKVRTVWPHRFLQRRHVERNRARKCHNAWTDLLMKTTSGIYQPFLPLILCGTHCAHTLIEILYRSRPLLQFVFWCWWKSHLCGEGAARWGGQLQDYFSLISSRMT